MESQDLKDYKEKLSQLTEEEQKQRDLHLKGLADGTIQGPNTGYPSIDKKWLSGSKEEGIISEVEDKSAYQQMYDSCKDTLDYTALNYFGFKITYREMLAKIDRIAASLVEAGVKPGEVVSVSLPNTPEAVMIFYAINKIGATANMIDVRFKADRLEQCINGVNSKKLLIFDEMIPEIDKIASNTNLDLIVPISATESLPTPIKLLQKLKNRKTKVEYNCKNLLKTYKDFLKIGNDKKVDVIYNPEVPAVFEHTSGTTGASKVVSLTNRTFTGLVHGYDNFQFEKKDQDVFLNIIPPFLAYGIVPSTHYPLSRKMEVVLIPKFDEEKFYDQLIQFKPAHTNATKMHWGAVKKRVEDMEFRVKDLTEKIKKLEEQINGSSTNLSDLRKQKKTLKGMYKSLEKAKHSLEQADFSFLVTGGIGGDSVSIEFENQMNEFLKKYNCKYKLSKGYGMTEVGSTFTVAPGTNSYGEGSVGIPLVKNNTMIYDFDKSEEIGYNKSGELLINGPTMMNEYLNNQNGTNETIVEIDGKKWVRTGDIAHISDEGALYIDGRIKRLIITDGGNKVFPINIENVILKSPAVQDVCVVGVPDEIRGNIVKAHIVIKKEYEEVKDAILQQIIEMCKEYIQDQSMPSEFQLDESLPKTPANKVDVKAIEKMDLEQKEKMGQKVR